MKCRIKSLLFVSVVFFLVYMMPTAQATVWYYYYPPFDLGETDTYGAGTASVSASSGVSQVKLWYGTGGALARVGTGAHYPLTSYASVDVTFNGYLDAYIAVGYFQWVEIWIKASIETEQGLVIDSEIIYYEAINYWGSGSIEIYEYFTTGELVARLTNPSGRWRVVRFVIEVGCQGWGNTALVIRDFDGDPVPAYFKIYSISFSGV